MSTESTQKRPTTLAELGMVMVEDTVCMDCSEGHCHTKGIATSKTFNRGSTWYIHIRVRREACEDLCGDYIYIGDFKINITEEDPRNKINIRFENELTCVNYLLENFDGIKCAN